MTLINVRPQELRLSAFQMILKARSVKSAIDSIDNEMKSLDEETFSGESAARLRSDYKKYRSHLLSSSNLIIYFARSLIVIASDFEKADRKLAFSILLPIFPIIGGIIGFLPNIIPGWGRGNLENFPSIIDETGESSGDAGGDVGSDGASTENVTEYQSGDYLVGDFNTEPTPPGGTWKEKCPAYVQAVIPNINNTSKGHASDYIEDYDLSPFSSSDDLRTQLEPGDVVVWNAGQESTQGSANPVYGHVAVVLEVHEDHVVLAESHWGGNPPRDPKYADNPYAGRELYSNDINGLYVWSNPEINADQAEVVHGS